MNMKPNGVIVIAFPSDEIFINNIHDERKANHVHLPPAHKLAEIINRWGFKAEVLAATPEEYIVEIKNQ